MRKRITTVLIALFLAGNLIIPNPAFGSSKDVNESKTESNASEETISDKGLDKTSVKDKDYSDFIMKKLNHAVYAESEEWNVKKEEFLRKIADASTYYEADMILKDYVKIAGGKHSNVFNPNDYNSPEDIKYPAHELKGNVLILRLPEFMGTKEESEKYAMELISSLKNEKYKGVIVDLSSNNGGDMGPMVLGISPLFPDGKVVSFTMGASKSQVTVKNGSISGGGTPLKLKEADFKVNVPVAVIQGEKTASSGEQTLLALKGRENVKTFGTVSAGYLTVNMLYPMKSGLKLMLSVGTTSDRDGTEYSEEGIKPNSETDPLYAEYEALKWLESKINDAQ